MTNFLYLANQQTRLMPNGEGIGLWNNNIFYPVQLNEIQEAENLLKHIFPDQLKNFYKQIGYGNLTTPYNAPEDYDFCNTNCILHPTSAANFAKGILFWDGQESYMAESTYELLEPGDLPFFEIGDSTSFMVMKLNSDNPNAIWYMGHEKIEDSFEKFIWRLYYEDPAYFAKDW